jgi:hypothetical protein
MGEPFGQVLVPKPSGTTFRPVWFQWRQGQQKNLRAQPVFSLLRPLTEP